jgi:hypothetical protein
MSQDDIQHTLAELKQQLGQLSDTDAAVKQRMEILIAAIESQLTEETSDEASYEDKGLIDQLNESVEQFEAEHPQVTGVLRRIMQTLSDMGI